MKTQILLLSVIVIIIGLIGSLGYASEPEPITIIETKYIDRIEYVTVVETEYIKVPVEPKEITFEVTAYTAFCQGCIGITYGGTDVRESIYHPSGYRIVAADKNILPLGTLVIIEGFNEIFIVDDIGSAIQGEDLDVLMETEREAFRWGRQRVGVKIVGEDLN